jgi:HK97 family phage major capsid protein
MLKKEDILAEALKLGIDLTDAEVDELVKAQKLPVKKAPDSGDITSVITSSLKDFTEEMKKLAAEVKAVPVGEDMKTVLLKTDANYRMSAFVTALKHVKGDDAGKREAAEKLLKQFAEETKAITEGMTVGAAADGGYLVPTLTDPSIFEFVKTSGQALRVFTIMPMGQNVINLPRYDGSVAGGWVGEASAITPEKGTLTVDVLTPKKWAGLLPLSNELLQGANPAIGSFLINILGKAEAYAIDGKTFQAGNTTLTGIFYTSNTFGGTTTLATTDPASLTYQKLVTATLAVDMNYNPKPIWMMSRSMLALCLNIVDDQNRPIFNYNTMTLLGYPVAIVEQAPTSAILASKAVIIFGDPSNSVLGDVAGRSVKIAEEGSVTINGAYVSLLENDMSAIRVVKSYAFAPRTNGYSVIKCATS